MNIQQQLTEQISKIKAKQVQNIFIEQVGHIHEQQEGVGRGRGSLRLFSGMSKALKKAKTSFDVNMLNKPPPEAKFNINNYYTLDIRLNPDDALSKFQSAIGTFIEAGKEGLTKIIGDNDNTKRVRFFIKEAYEASEQGKESDARRSAEKSKRRSRYSNVEESVSTFDVIFELLLSEKQTIQDKELSNKIVIFNKIKIGDKLTYITKSGKRTKVIVKGLPREFSSGEKEELTLSNEHPEDMSGLPVVSEATSVATAGALQVGPEGAANVYAVPVFTDGELRFPDLKMPPSDDVADIEDVDDGDSSWKKEWDSKTIEELFQVQELADVIENLPAFFVGDQSEKGYACVPSVEKFVRTISQALESAFRGSVKNGTTWEELFSGKFGKKMVNPEKGAFINKIQDQSSSQPLDFRNWSQEDAIVIHTLIMHTFSHSDKLKFVPIEKAGGRETTINDPSDPSQKVSNAQGLVLYMTQTDFDSFIKGGQGLKQAIGAVGEIASGLTPVLSV